MKKRRNKTKNIKKSLKSSKLSLSLIIIFAITLFSIIILNQVYLNKNSNLTANAIEDSEICISEWACTDWGACENGFQLRQCTDSNNCQNTLDIPSVMQPCEMPIQENQNSSCIPRWNCTKWGICKNKIKTKICNDLNNCQENKIESKNCTRLDVNIDITFILIILLVLGFIAYITTLLIKRFKKRSELLEAKQKGYIRIRGI